MLCSLHVCAYKRHMDANNTVRTHSHVICRCMLSNGMVRASWQFFCFSVFGTSKGRFWHVDRHCNQPYSFSVSVFLEVEGAILARRRTLGPALQFFCFSVFGTSKGRFWHVDGHMGPCLTVFLFSVFRRSTVGTSTDIGTSLTVFLFFCFWHVEGALLARRRTLGLALQFF